MSIYRASFGAWFSRSALLNIRGTGLAWLMYIFGLVDSLLYTAGDDRDMALFWSVFATVIIGQQFSVFLHRLTAGVESSLIPGYRRSQWRVFIAMSAMAMIACAAPFYLLGLAPAGAIGIAMLVFGATVWCGFKFAYGIAILLLGAAALIAMDNQLSALPMSGAWWLVFAAVPGAAFVWHAGHHYLKGEDIAVGVRLDRRALGCSMTGPSVNLRLLDRVNQGLLDRRLAQPAMAHNEIARLAAGCYTPVWSSGIPAMLIYFVASALMWLIISVVGESSAGVALVALPMTCMVAAFISTAQLEMHRRHWPQYWLAITAAGRRAWTDKMAGSYLLVQGRCFLAAAAAMAILGAATHLAPVKIVITAAIGFDIFLLVSATALLLLPLSSRIGEMWRVILFFALLGIGCVIGVVMAGALAGMLPATGQFGVGAAGVFVWSLLLTIVALHRLPRMAFAVKDVAGLNTVWGLS